MIEKLILWYEWTIRLQFVLNNETRTGVLPVRPKYLHHFQPTLRRMSAFKYALFALNSILNLQFHCKGTIDSLIIYQLQMYIRLAINSSRLLQVPYHLISSSLCASGVWGDYYSASCHNNIYICILINNTLQGDQPTTHALPSYRKLTFIIIINHYCYDHYYYYYHHYYHSWLVDYNIIKIRYQHYTKLSLKSYIYSKHLQLKFCSGAELRVCVSVGGGGG